MKTLPLLFTLAAFWSTSVARAADAPTPPPLPQIPAKTFSIADHAAKPDAQSDNAKAIQDTIDAAEAAGGGTVEIPAGEYLSGPIRIASTINLQLDKGAMLKMLPIDRYPGGTQNPQSFITGQGLHDVEISGEGTIDGQGAPWWPLATTTPTARRPRMIALSGCDKILIDNLTLQNSPMFHIAISGHSTNVTVRGVTIKAPPSTDPTTPSHNTDACDVSGSNVLI